MTLQVYAAQAPQVSQPGQIKCYDIAEEVSFSNEPADSIVRRLGMGGSTFVPVGTIEVEVV